MSYLSLPEIDAAIAKARASLLRVDRQLGLTGEPGTEEPLLDRDSLRSLHQTLVEQIGELEAIRAEGPTQRQN